MRTLRPREAKQLTVKYVHGGAKAGLPMKGPFLPSGPLQLWMQSVKIEGTARRPGEQPKGQPFSSVDKKRSKA